MMCSTVSTCESRLPRRKNNTPTDNLYNTLLACPRRAYCRIYSRTYFSTTSKSRSWTRKACSEPFPDPGPGTGPDLRTTYLWIQNHGDRHVPISNYNLTKPNSSGSVLNPAATRRIYRRPQNPKQQKKGETLCTTSVK